MSLDALFLIGRVRSRTSPSEFDSSATLTFDTTKRLGHEPSDDGLDIEDEDNNGFGDGVDEQYLTGWTPDKTPVYSIKLSIVFTEPELQKSLFFRRIIFGKTFFKVKSTFFFKSQQNF